MCFKGEELKASLVHPQPVRLKAQLRPSASPANQDFSVWKVVSVGGVALPLAFCCFPVLTDARVMTGGCGAERFGAGRARRQEHEMACWVLLAVEKKRQVNSVLLAFFLF